jgi:hypothetical protein
MSCENVEGCPLFPLFSIKSSLALWKTYYCEADYSRCARLRLRAAGELVPPNLLPNGKLLASLLDRDTTAGGS